MTTSDFINSIVAFTGVMTSILTFFIIKESRLMRKFYSTPEISVFLKFAEASPTLLFIYIENMGMGTAHNVEFKLLEDFKYYERDVDKLSSKGVFKNSLQHFYPKQRFKYLIDSLQDRTDDELKDPIVVSVTYSDDYGKLYERLFSLNIELYGGGGMITPGDTHLRVISYRLEQIQKDFKSLTAAIVDNLRKKNN